MEIFIDHRGENLGSKSFAKSMMKEKLYLGPKGNSWFTRIID